MKQNNELPSIKNVSILNLEIEMYGELTDDCEVDLGSVTLSREGREFELDIVQSSQDYKGGVTKIICDLKTDPETHANCRYDLTQEDIMSSDLQAKVFVGGDFSPTIEHATLAVKVDGMTKMIDVSLDSDVSFHPSR